MPAAAPLDRASALAALRSLQGKAPIKFNDLPSSLRRAVRLHWGGVHEARRAARLPAPPPAAQVWTRESVLAEIRTLAASGQHMSQNAVALVRTDLLEAARKQFGRWVAARDSAGIPRPPRPIRGATASWDEAAVMISIRRRLKDAESLAVTKTPSALVNAANRLFGSWRLAIEAAGLDYEQIVLKRRRTDDELVAWVRDAARMHPSLTADGFNRLGVHANACRLRWGSLEAIAAAAGVNDWPARTAYRAMPRSALIGAIRSRAGRGESLAFSRVRAATDGERLLKRAIANFPTWDEAVKAAGLPTQRLVRVSSTKEQALRQLNRWHREGVALAYRDVERRDPGAYTRLSKMFGSFSAAVAAAGLSKVRARRRT